MRALRYTRTGPAAEVLRIVEMPAPLPRAREVLVRVHASGVNPHDTKKRSGWSQSVIPPEGVVPHSDGAGVIEAVGDEVSPRRIGERVFVQNARPLGTAAEYVVVPSERAFHLPGGMSFAQGASLGVPAFTAWLAVLADGPVLGRTILVQGGGGAVGRVAVELAVRSGARVIATAGSEASRAVAAAKGADLVLDRHGGTVAAAVMEATGGRGADRIVDVDFGANQATDIAALAEGGVVAAYSSSSDKSPVLDYYAFARKSARLTFVQGSALSPAHLAEAARVIGLMLNAGHLYPDVAEVFPFERAAEAHALVEKGAPANVVVAIA